MMKKYLTLIILALTVVISTNAQNISQNCYRGYVDLGYSIGVGDYEFDRFEINTSHGYQFTPYLFFGAGFGFHFMNSYESKTLVFPDTRDNKVDIPIFANIRCNFLKKKISPFIDVKGGTYVTNNGELYVNASIGCRFSIDKKQAINLSIGYSVEELEFEIFDSFIGYSMDYYTMPVIKSTESITLKLGFEF